MDLVWLSKELGAYSSLFYFLNNQKPKGECAVIMGLDQSFTSTGVVITNHAKEVVNFHLIKTGQNKLDPLDTFKRCITISNIINKIVSNTAISEVIIENLGFGSVGNATRNLAMLQSSIINKIIENHPHIKISLVPPTTLKKFATGSGKASKQEMYEALPQEVKEKFSDIKKTKGLYDITDAFFLATYSREST